ncbi:MAG: hypothetical protein AAGA30_22000, partial [Planctomycetota bacterium]
RRSNNWPVRIYTIAIGFTVLLFLFLGLMQAMVIHSLLHIATLGIENSMQRPGAIQMGELMTESSNWNDRIRILTDNVNRCVPAAALIVISLGLLIRFRNQWTAYLFLGLCLIGNYLLTTRLTLIFNQDIANLNFVWQETVVYPSGSAIIALLLFCIFCGFAVSIRCNRPVTIACSATEMSKFNLPMWLLISSFLLSIPELLIYSQWNPLNFIFGGSQPSFLGINFSTSEYSLVQSAGKLWHFQGGYFHLVWSCLLFILITKGILVHAEASNRNKNEAWVTTTVLNRTTILTTIGLASSLVPITLFLANFGFVSCLDHRSITWQFATLIAFEDFNYKLFAWPSALLATLVAGLWIRNFYFQKQDFPNAT